SNFDVVGNDFRTSNGTNGAIAGTLPSSSRIEGNPGYNPVGVSTVTPGASPWTYTSGPSPETLYLYGGTVSSITQGGTQIAQSSPAALQLGPNEAVVVTYSSVPTARKMVH